MPRFAESRFASSWISALMVRTSSATASAPASGAVSASSMHLTAMALATSPALWPPIPSATK